MLYRSTKQQVVEAIQVTEAVDVPTSNGVLRAEPGDWLILDPQGNLTRCDNTNFQCTFESAEDSDQHAQISEGQPCGC